MKDMNFKETGNILASYLDKNEKPIKVEMVTINRTVARSGLSAVISLYYKDKEGALLHLQTGRVHGCGLDRGFEAAYNTYCKVFGYNGWPYQEHLKHSWL